MKHKLTIISLLTMVFAVDLICQVANHPQRFTRNICPTMKAENLPEPYKSIEVLPLELWGWLNISNQILIPKLLKQCNAKIVVELGSWLGAFTTLMANNIDDDAKVYAVDVWTETPECSIAMQPINENDLHKFYKTLYQQFLSNMIHEQLTHKVIPVRMTTLQAAKELTIHPDLIYVDAAHDEESVYNDIKAWYEKLAVGGIMSGDDWGWPSVQKSVVKIAKELEQTIHFDWNFWWFDPKPAL